MTRMVLTNNQNKLLEILRADLPATTQATSYVKVSDVLDNVSTAVTNGELPSEMTIPTPTTVKVIGCVANFWKRRGIRCL